MSEEESAKMLDKSETQDKPDNINNGQVKNNQDEKVQMKKELGLVEGTAIILGIIIGSGEIRLDQINLYIGKVILV